MDRSQLSQDQWKPKHYDENLSFVSRLGGALLRLLSPQPGERILDVGCGTGDLTAELARLGADCTGIDASASMIEEACVKHAGTRGLQFRVADAREYRGGDCTFDAVFSNAALHWIRPPEQAVATMWCALRPGGRAALEFGGKGNVGAVVGALIESLRGRGFAAESPWYFPSVAEYAALLEECGFEVRYAELFDRPTQLIGGDEGLFHWLNAFAFPFFADRDWPPEEKQAVYEEVAERLRSDLYRSGEWFADYRRLRLLAVKPHSSQS
ncbi:class I SAM-dependent methyltransferase [Paenibacillus chartarius]|uniref:Class I SAM-dependent methyltransferase n=1 Tax=Paenibacillus chartarius TaxID=747481 RepID=A0ABV6DK95_9BACL